jgi:hypothetical protein
LKVFSGALPLPFARWFLFSSGSYSYPSILPWREDHLINAISVEEELGRAQSNPTHAKDFGAG